MKSTSSKKTIANGATSNWPRNMRGLRGNFMRAGGNSKLEIRSSKFEIREKTAKLMQPGATCFDSEFQTFGDDIDDFSGGAFHVQHDRIDAADKVVVGGMGRDGDGQSRGGANEGLPNPIGKHAEMRVQSLFLHEHEGFDKAEDGAEESEQGRELGDSGEQIQLFFKTRHFGQAGFFEGFTDAFTAM